jgi:hypothetical protein
MAYKVWSKVKAGKPVVMTISEIKNALALGELGLDDEYEGPDEGLGRKRVRLGDVTVFRDAGAKAPVKKSHAGDAQVTTIEGMIEARRLSLRAAAEKPTTEEPAKSSGMLTSWRACLISLGLSFAACPALLSGARTWVVIASFIGLLFVVQLLRGQEEVKPSLFITPIVFGLVAYWGFDSRCGPWFNGVMTMALCLAGSLMVDEFDARFAGSFMDRLFIFIKYAYALVFSVWLGWAGFDDMPGFLTMTASALGKGGEQAILLSLVALPLLVFLVLGLLACVVAALSWLKDGPPK